MSQVYVAGLPVEEQKRRRWPWVALLLFLIIAGLAGWLALQLHTKPQTTIKQTKAVTTAFNTGKTATKHFDEPDFGIDLPATWQALPAIASPYQLYRFQSTDSHGKLSNQVIEIYENTIPVQFSVNRVLIVEGANDRVSQQGSASDNCQQYTIKGSVTASPLVVPARWQGVDFFCDEANTQRNRVGTSSTDGVSTVILKSPSTGQSHTFLFSLTDDQINPDYTPLYDMLNSFRMK